MHYLCSGNKKTSHKTSIISHGTNGKYNSRASRSRAREKARLLHQAKGWGTIIGPIDVENVSCQYTDEHRQYIDRPRRVCV